MTRFTAEKVGAQRWSGPEWARHIAGKALAEQRAKPVPVSWLDELVSLYTAA